MNQKGVNKQIKQFTVNHRHVYCNNCLLINNKLKDLTVKTNYVTSQYTWDHYILKKRHSTSCQALILSELLWFILLRFQMSKNSHAKFCQHNFKTRLCLRKHDCFTCSIVFLALIFLTVRVSACFTQMLLKIVLKDHNLWV